MRFLNLLPSHYIEHEFFGKILENLDKATFSDITLVITHDYKQIPEQGKNVVVLLTAGDEQGKPPSYSNEVLVVFKHHLDVDRTGNVYHLPLPYVNGFIGTPAIAIRERRTDVFFAGRSSRREDMLVAVEKLQQRRKDLKITCYVTGTKFMRGWPIATYSREMMDSKIVLSPRGAVRAECLRFTEAVKCGCAIIACEHPALSCFRETPAEYLQTWDGLEQAVDRLLEEKTLEEVSRRMVHSWDRWFSPQGQAKIMSSVVTSLRQE